MTERRGRQLVSTLLIERADLAHAGKFTCAPSYAKPDTVTLHVVDGEDRPNTKKMLKKNIFQDFSPPFLSLRGEEKK